MLSTFRLYINTDYIISEISSIPTVRTHYIAYNLHINNTMQYIFYSNLI